MDWVVLHLLGKLLRHALANILGNLLLQGFAVAFRNVANLRAALAVHALLLQCLFKLLEQLLQLLQPELTLHLPLDVALHLRRGALHPLHTRLLSHLFQLFAGQPLAAHQPLHQFAQLCIQRLHHLLHRLIKLRLLLLA